MSNGRFSNFLRFLTGAPSGKPQYRNRFNKSQKKAPSSVLGTLEILEDRTVPATLYVDLPANYTITNDTGSKGLTTGDTVTWNGATAKTGLIYGTTAFGSVATAEAASSNNDTINVNAAAYSDGAVSVPKDGQTFNVPANTTGFSILLTTGSNTSFTLTGAGSVNVVGNTGNNTLTGNAGNNTFSGEGGADTITGGAGNDTITGGSGMDTAVFSGSRSNYTITVSGGTTTVVDNRSGSPDGTDTLTGVEKIKFNGDGTTVRNVPSSLGFTVGTSSQAATTSLVFGTSMIDPDSTQNGGKPTIVFQLSGNTTDGYFSWVNDGTVTINGSMSNLQLQGTPAALNAYLNSGNIKYNSLTSATRTITMQVDDNQNANGYVNLVANTGTTPVFTSANSTSVTYGQSLSFTIAATATPAATYSVTTGTLPSGVTLNSTSGVLSGTTAAGTYSFTVTATSGSKTATQAFTLTVNKVALTVTAAAKTKTYGDADPALTYSITTGALVGSDSLTGSLTRATGENAGTYAISQGTLAASSNYTVTFVSANLTVSKATLSITAAAKSKTYGDADPSLTYTVSGLKNSDTSSVVTGSLTRTAGENAGTYAINQGTVVASANYEISYSSANLTIGKASLTVTAAAKSKTYGDADPTLTYSITTGALVSGDSLTGSLTRATGENVGTYAISQGTLAANSNYTVTFVSANLTVSKATLTVTAAAKTKTYGDADPALTYTVSGLKNSDTSSVVTGSLTRTAGENAGTYAINQGTVVASANYNVSYTSANLTIGKATLTVTAAAKSKTYGDADPTFTYTVSGLKNSDTASVVTGTLARTAGENVGTYAINQGTVVASANYTVSFTTANLTVGKATLTVTAAAKSKTYGDADPALTYSVSGLKNSDTASVVTGSLARAAGENVGTYAINQGTVVASANYNVTFTGANLTVGKRAATITATNVTGTYGTATLGNAFTVANLASGETVGSVTITTNATLSGAAKYKAGSWTITPSAATGGNFNANNYTFTYANGTFTVNKATLTVTAIGANKNYDGNTSATVTLSNDDLVGDVVVANAASKTFADATVGFGKTITVSGLTISGADAANYTLGSTSTTTTGNIIGSGIVGNNLVIVGTGVDDEIIIAINPKNTSQIYVTWKVNGTSTTTPYSIVGLTGVNVHGGDGNDKLTLNAEVPLTATFYGDAGNDTLRGGNYNDKLYGNEGNDTLYGSLGDDYLDGGAGSDTLNGQDGNDILIAGLEDNLPNILDGGAGSDTLTGSNGDDTLTGGTNSATDGADTIYGLGGNDKIFGGAGNDIIDGGTGDDNIDGGEGNDTINVGDGNNIVNGSYGDDTIVAGNGNNTLNGNDGNDTITAGNGNNALNGGGGNDVITGGHGNNTVWAGDGNDTVTVGNGNNLVIGAMGDDTITAGNGNNILVGEMGNDTITAGSGNNVIVGGGGLDTIKTGNGNNLVIGGSTIYDETDPSLRSILNEWVRTDITTAQKKINLANGVGSGNAVKLTAGKTVIDDLLADKVFLGTGDNWLWF